MKKSLLFYYCAILSITLLIVVSSCANLFGPSYLEKASDPKTIPENDPAYVVNILSDPDFLDIISKIESSFSSFFLLNLIC